MSCEAFERWLDEGRPARDEPAAHAHAGGCARCAAALRVALELEAVLERDAAPAPAAFTAAVMARIAVVDVARARVQPLPSPFDWWVRAASDPAAVLALLVAGLLLWRGEALLRIAAPAALRLAGAAARLGVPHPPLLDLPGVPLALALAALPFLLWGSWRLYRTAERACAVWVCGAAWQGGTADTK